MTVEIYNGASFYRFEMMDFDVSDGGGGGGGGIRDELGSALLAASTETSAGL